MAQVPAKGLLSDIQTELLNRKAKINALVPQQMSTERLVNMALFAISKSPKLLSCTKASIVRSFMNASLLGLEIGDGVASEAYLVPFYNTRLKKDEATFIPSYRGLAKLAIQHGGVKVVYAKLVYAEELRQNRFSYTEGTKPSVTHNPIVFGERGECVGGYGIAVTDKDYPSIVFMRMEELEKVRQSSKASERGPWVDWWEQMAMKTLVKRVLKLIPMTEMLKAAERLDTQAEAGLQQDDLSTDFDVEVEAKRLEEKPEPKSKRLTEQIQAQSEPAKEPTPEPEVMPEEEEFRLG